MVLRPLVLNYFYSINGISLWYLYMKSLFRKPNFCGIEQPKTEWKKKKTKKPNDTKQKQNMHMIFEDTGLSGLASKNFYYMTYMVKYHTLLGLTNFS